MGEGNIFSLCVSSHLGGGGLGGGYPFPGPGGGVPPSQVQVGRAGPGGEGRGYPFLGPGKGVPPSQVQVEGTTPNWNSIACTCYAVGGMPLVFMQEDFFGKIRILKTYLNHHQVLLVRQLYMFVNKIYFLFNLCFILEFLYSTKVVSTLNYVVVTYIPVLQKNA